MKKLSKQFFTLFSSRLLGQFSTAVICYAIFLFLQLGSFNFSVPLANSLEDIPQEFSQRDFAQFATSYRGNNSRLLRNNSSNTRNKKLLSVFNYATIVNNNILDLPKITFPTIAIDNYYFTYFILLKSIPIRAGPIVC